MSEPVSDKYLFQPQIPQWLIDYCFSRRAAYEGFYTALGNSYASDPDVFWSGPNIDIDTINSYGQGDPYNYGTFDSPIIAYVSSTHIPWTDVFWPIGLPPPETPTLDYRNAMCCGLFVWQMYHIFLAEQFTRFGEFGHYGRKPKGAN